METLARWSVIAGLVLVVIGGALYGAARAGLGLGHLPGDIRIETAGGTIFLPLATSILISVVLTVILNLVLRMIKK